MKGWSHIERARVTGDTPFLVRIVVGYTTNCAAGIMKIPDVPASVSPSSPSTRLPIRLILCSVETSSLLHRELLSYLGVGHAQVAEPQGQPEYAYANEGVVTTILGGGGRL